MKKHILSKLLLLRYSNRKNNQSPQSLGLTTLEVMIITLIGSITLNAALAGFSSVRQIYLKDRSINNLNQRLRGAVSRIGIDLQSTGEKLVSDPNFPAIEITQQTIPNSNEKTSELIVRKGTVFELPICQTISAGSSDPIVIVDNDSTDGNCLFSQSLDNTKDGIPDKLKRWMDTRQENGGTIEGYIFDGSGKGEYFTYTGETFRNENGGNMSPSKTDIPHEVHLNVNNQGWKNTYNENTAARIYILDEIRYQIKDNTLQSVQNNDANLTLDLVENIERIEVKATLEKNGEEYVCYVLPPSNSGDCDFPSNDKYSWNLIKNIEIKAVAFVDPDKDKTLQSLTPEDLEYSQKFFPRNAYSF